MIILLGLFLNIMFLQKYQGIHPTFVQAQGHFQFKIFQALRTVGYTVVPYL